MFQQMACQLRVADQLDRVPRFGCRRSPVQVSFGNRRSSAAVRLPGNNDSHAVRLVTQPGHRECLLALNRTQ